MTELCEARIPSYFVVTVMTAGRVAVNTTTVHHDHQLGSQVTIRIELPQNADMCSLLVSIRAGNSAGMSSLTEIEVGRSHYMLIETYCVLSCCFFSSFFYFLCFFFSFFFFFCMQNVPLTTQTAFLLPALELIQPDQLNPHQLKPQWNKDSVCDTTTVGYPFKMEQLSFCASVARIFFLFFAMK